MRTFSHLYEKTISIENLFQAWDEFKRGKRKKNDVGLFELNLEDNIFKLHETLASKTYKHGRYYGFYIIDPKVRHIHKANVRDRIVHHALFNTLNPIFEFTFISDSYSCRKGYGTHKGFRKLITYARKVSSNYTNECWALKCDIKKFFYSVDHKILLSIIKRRIKDKELIQLLSEIIDSYETLLGKGIPIGNLTSQLFANIYMNELDQFVKHRMHVKYYLRYTDDFILLSNNRNDLTQYINILRRFLLGNLKLELHSNKTVIRRLEWGVDFLGYVALSYHSVLRTKTKRRIFKNVEKKITLFREDYISRENLHQTLASYFGILKHVNAYGLARLLRGKIEQ